MARIQDQNIIITVSKLVKDDSKFVDIVSADMLESLEAVVGELLSDPSVVVEIVTDAPDAASGD